MRTLPCRRLLRPWLGETSVRACAVVPWIPKTRDVAGVIWRGANAPVAKELLQLPRGAVDDTPLHSACASVRMKSSTMLLLALEVAAVAIAQAVVPGPASQRNLLYVVFDDLRPDLSAYDVPFMKTPNIQQLADTGLTFERAYCQEAVCSPSRNSFTTGRRPNSTKVW